MEPPADLVIPISLLFTSAAGMNGSCRLLHSSAMYRYLILFFLCLSCKTVLAHPMPGSMVNLFILEKTIKGEARIPLIELQNALGDNRDYTRLNSPFFQDYFSAHIGARTDNRKWTTTIDSAAVTTDTDSIIGKYREVIVYFELAPPAAAAIRQFLFDYDVVIHQVITHKVYVNVEQDWMNGVHAENKVQQLGVIALDIPSGKIPPFMVNLEQGSWLKGFKAMFQQGVQHIGEGTDHLLFLLVLLLPAMLTVRRGQWGEFGGSGYSLVRVLRIVTAFTVGHSITLLVGAMGWLNLPQQLVEVVIAFSILVSAIHAVRPVFAGREVYIAAGFGLIHGLAFAGFLARLKLGAGTMALSILGFNMGIELMQLFIITLIIPWLLLAARTSYYPWLKNLLAVLSALAAIAWMAERITGKENLITGITAQIPVYGSWGIISLAVVSVLMVGYYFLKGKERVSLLR